MRPYPFCKYRSPNPPTWDPSNTMSGIVLSSGNTLATNSSGNNGVGSTRSVTSHSSGKWYAEVVNTQDGTSNFNSIGIALGTAPVNAFAGTRTDTWAYYEQTGQKYTNNTVTAYGSVYTVGDVIGIAYDASAGSLTFLKNNVSQGVAFTGLSGAMYIFCSPWRGTSTYAALTAHFSAASLVYSPPAGYSAWG